MLGNWLKTSILMAGIVALFGAVGAMLALPLSLIMMTIANELFPERKTTPHLPG